MQDSQQPDETKLVQRAYESGSLTRMLRVLDRKCDSVTRHFLLLSIVEETYNERRNDSEMRALCERVAKLHAREFSKLAVALKADDREYGGEGRLPHVPTFQHLATILTEKGNFAGAVRICKRALDFGLIDGTKGGYEGRIERIRSDAKRARVSDKAKSRPPLQPRTIATPKKRSTRVPEFKQYNPTEDEMTARQRRFYHSWREFWRKGVAVPVDGQISYLFLYTYSVLERGPKRAPTTLQRLINSYEESEPTFVEGCRWWLSDCYVAIGDYARALELFPPLKPSGRSAGGTDSLLSLKLRVGTRLTGRDVLTLNGPRVTKWGREHLEQVEAYVDTIVSAHEREERADLLKEWAKSSHSYPYGVFNGSHLQRASNIRAYSFSACPAATEFAKKITREAENSAREEIGLPKVNEGWIAETNLLYELKRALEGREVIHHARPKWLGRQHLDIFIPSLNVAIEFQGRQHDEPVAYFGGAEAFKAQQRRDKLKAKRCRENGVHLMLVRPGYLLTNVVDEILFLPLRKECSGPEEVARE